MKKCFVFLLFFTSFAVIAVHFPMRSFIPSDPEATLYDSQYNGLSRKLTGQFHSVGGNQDDFRTYKQDSSAVNLQEDPSDKERKPKIQPKPFSPNNLVSNSSLPRSRKYEVQPGFSEPTGSSKLSSALSTDFENTPKFGYTLVLSYLGQQAAGLRSLVSQQCMVGSLHLPMYVVEPFIQDSKFRGFMRSPHSYVNDQIPSMKDFFDIDHYNAAAEEKGWRQLASWEDFMQNAPQRVVFFRLKLTTACQCVARDKPKFSSPPKVAWSASATDSCYKGELKDVQNLPNGKNLCVVRIINATASPFIDLSTGEEVIFGQWKPNEVTVVFNRWCPSTYVQKTELTGACKGACEKELDNLLHPSPKMLKHATKYERKFLTARNNFKVAVMIRSERMPNKNTVDCLNDVVKVSHGLQENSTESVFVTADVGRYGSGSWTERDPQIAKWMQSVKDTVIKLLKNSLTFEEWEDTFTDVTDGITDRGYIAALQRTTASRADCLVLAGGGNFLLVALYEYLDSHSQPAEWCIRFLCVEEKFKKRYNSILASRVNTSM